MILTVFMQLLVNGLVTGSVYAIAAVGISLVYGILRLVNFAYGDMMAFAAYTGYFANATLGLPMIASASFAMAAGAVLAVALDFALWRPLRVRRAGFMSLFLASIGVALVLRQAILLIWGPQPRAYDVDPTRSTSSGMSACRSRSRDDRRGGNRHRPIGLFLARAQPADVIARCRTTELWHSCRRSTSTG